MQRESYACFELTARKIRIKSLNRNKDGKKNNPVFVELQSMDVVKDRGLIAVLA